MSRVSPFITVVLVFFGVATGRAQQDHLVDVVPQPGVLVLRGETVLAGNIRFMGSHYIVQLGGGSEVNLPADRVRLRADSMRGAYAKLAAQLSPRATATEQLELGDWCLRYELVAEAARQLMAAISIAGETPETQRFERRLHLAAHPPKTASKQTAVVGRPTVAAARVEQALDGLSPGAIEQFSQIIQPLMLNRCAGAQCHGSPDTGELWLVRPAKGQLLTRRMTQQNLFHALQLLRTDSPSASPLLVRAADEHAAPNRLMRDNQNAMLAELAAWAHRVAAERQSTRPAAIAADNRLLSQTDNRPARVSTSSSPQSAATRGPAGHVPADSSAQQPVSAAATQHSARPAASHLLKRDPFDPEPFNRQYARRRDD